MMLPTIGTLLKCVLNLESNNLKFEPRSGNLNTTIATTSKSESMFAEQSFPSEIPVVGRCRSPQDKNITVKIFYEVFLDS